jgi:hypothetical protein
MISTLGRLAFMTAAHTTATEASFTGLDALAAFAENGGSSPEEVKEPAVMPTAASFPDRE